MNTTRPIAPATAWHQLDTARVFAALQSGPSGLSEAEAALRLSEKGPNVIREPARISPLALFLGQFQSLIVWILLIAGAIAGFLGERTDAIAIFAIVILNAAIGFYQEFNAEKSIAALKKMTAPRAKVLRNGHVTVVPASQIVIGDRVELEAGDLIPADARLIEAVDLRCTEAALTGESEPVRKNSAVLNLPDLPLGDRRNMAYMGTHVATGNGQAVITATGMETEIGRIAGLIESAEDDESSPLQRRLDSFGKILVWICLGVIAVMFGAGMLRHLPFFELFLTSVSLAVAAIPEGLPAVVTIALALGVQRMAKRNALIRRLPAVETLGSASVICTDKTGTLTLGEMTVRESFPAASPELLAQVQTATVTASLEREQDRWKTVGDPTEVALLIWAAKLGVTRDAFAARPKLFEYPFDSDRKRASALRRMPEGFRLTVNGAPDVLLGLCTQVATERGPVPLTPEERVRILQANDAMASKALRVIGSAYRDLSEVPETRPDAESMERDLVFAGLSGMQDPPRPEAKEAVAKCRDAGIRVIMITGDHPATALAVARELGLAASDRNVLTGVELEKLDDDALRARVADIAVYARVTAEHKLRIVRAWKAQGAVVAMTGDGVNDAPALKGSDIGVAMGQSGTEVTKQASDMVLTDDNFSSIVAAVEEGRGIYDNIRKTLSYLMTGNTGELLLMTVAVAAGWPTPLLPVHLLWINLVTDGLPALCLASDPVEPGVMKRGPRARGEKLANSSFLGTLVLGGMLTASVSLIAFWLGWKSHGLTSARSYAFTALVFAELFRAFGSRSETLPLWRIGLRGNIKLVVVVALSVGLQLVGHESGILETFFKTASLSLSECLLLFGMGLIPSIALEAVKVWRTRTA